MIPEPGEPPEEGQDPPRLEGLNVHPELCLPKVWAATLVFISFSPQPQVLSAKPLGISEILWEEARVVEYNHVVLGRGVPGVNEFKFMFSSQCSSLGREEV